MEKNKKKVVMNTKTEAEVMKMAEKAFNTIYRSVGGYSLTPSSYLASNKKDLKQTSMLAYIEGYKLYCTQNNLRINNLSKANKNAAGACAYKRAEWAFLGSIRMELDNPMHMSARSKHRDKAVKNFFEQRQMKMTDNLCESDLHMLMRQMELNDPEKVKQWIVDYAIRHDPKFIVSMDEFVNVTDEAQYDDDYAEGIRCGCMEYDRKEAMITEPVTPQKREQNISKACTKEVHRLLKNCKVLTNAERKFLIDYFGLDDKKVLTPSQLKSKYHCNVTKMRNKTLNKLRKYYENEGITSLGDLL